MSATDEPVVLITGGSSGIGRAIVEELVDGGKKVAFTYRSGEDRARAIAEASKGRAQAFRLDLSERSRPKELIRELEENVGPIEALINNAGVEHSGLLAMTSDVDWDRVIDVNLGGVFRCCRAVVPMMVRRRRGSIVSISSLGALRGVAGQATYAASKAGVLALTRSLAREVGKRGIRVNAVVPGYVFTEMTSDLSERAVDSLRAGEALATGVSASAVASTVTFLLSEAAEAITGQCLNVDAGASA